MAFADPHLPVELFPCSSSSILQAPRLHGGDEGGGCWSSSGRGDSSDGAELLCPVPDDSHGLSIASQRTAGDLVEAAEEGSSCSRAVAIASGVSTSPWTPISVVVAPAGVSTIAPTRLCLSHRDTMDGEASDGTLPSSHDALATLCGLTQQHQAACKTSLRSVVAQVHKVVQHVAAMSTAKREPRQTAGVVPLDVVEALAREQLRGEEQDERCTLLCSALREANACWKDACGRESAAVDELSQLLADAEQEAQETVAHAASESLRARQPSSHSASTLVSSPMRKSGVRRSRHYLTLAASMAAGLAESKTRFEAELREAHQQEIQRLCAEFDGKLERRRLGEHALREEIFSLRCQLAQAYGTVTPPSLSLEDLMQTPFVQTHVQREIDRRLSRASECNSATGVDEGGKCCCSPNPRVDEVEHRAEHRLSTESSQECSWSAGAAACKRRHGSAESSPSAPRGSEGGGDLGSGGFVAFGPLADKSSLGSVHSPFGRPSSSTSSCGSASSECDGH